MLLAGKLEDCHASRTEPTKPNLLVRNTFLPTFCRKIDPRTFRKRPKSRPRGSKIEAWGLQNRARRPPRRPSLKTSNLRGFKRAGEKFIGGFKSQLGSNSMCFARTAALQGGDKRQKVKASRVFVQHLQHNVQKWLKTGSRRAKTGPRQTRDSPITGPTQTQISPNTGPRHTQNKP